MRQVDSFGGQRGRWLVLVDKETVGRFWWTKRRVASCGGKRDRWTVEVDKEGGG